MIARRVVLALSYSQLVCWGISYYLIGGFGPLIAADFGWSAAWVYGGFSFALVVMGLCSGWVGRRIDTQGGRPVMVAGSVLTALGCAWLASAHGLVEYYLAWGVLGLAMRCTLYDAAFAALARLYGPAARRPISQITLAGGLASTTFWPLGHALGAAYGWRGALWCYAGFALSTVLVHLLIPRGRYTADAAAVRAMPAPLADTPEAQRLAGGLYALIAVLTNFLNSAMSAHMIGVLSGLGLAATTAVTIAALRGVGQSSARLAELVFGARLHPLDLNLGAIAALPLCFLGGLFSGQWLVFAVAFAFAYGAGNGLITITRGSLPLVLFDVRVYGSLVGRLLAPSFIVSAAAPLAYAVLIAHWGERAALVVSALIAAIALAAAWYLRARFDGHRR